MVRSSTSPLADSSASEDVGLQPEAKLRELPAEQALAMIGMGLMRKLAADGETGAWMWTGEEVSGSADVTSLRQRLELVDLALRTAAPLTTAEVTHLLGARPGAPVVERGGLVARRRGRNIWILSRGGDAAATGALHFQETPRRRF